ncbi:Gag-Pol polyprotein [Trachymyrmex cornetzi]|uniref:ribonuclease H n=1 Tax=Trachymyrmex cornetzi TaxID=471704 RepID=A0A151K3C1_9HYME|nr:Gag-Pol polyprotein [Trachymyrmex cornetzi]
MLLVVMKNPPSSDLRTRRHIGTHTKSSLPQSNFYHKSFEFRQNAKAFYTDGSKSPEGAVGAAVYSPELEGSIKHKLPPETSIFSAELWAIYQAILAIFDLNFPKSVIFSDSRSALDALQNSSKVQRNYIVYQIRKAYLDIIDKGNEVTLFWVPAHSGIPGNELADQEANLAAIEGYKPDFKVPYEDLLVESRARADKQFQEYMEEVSRTKGTRYFEQFHTISKKTWFHESSLSREEIVLINRLRSNHINVNESLHRVNMTELSMRRPPSDNKSFNLPLQ